MAIRIRTIDEAKPVEKPAKRAPSAKARVIRAGRGRPPSGKERITIRFDADLLAFYRKTGSGWQARMNDALRKAAGL